MAARTPIYEQYARKGQSIRSIQPVPQSTPEYQHQQNKNSISLISSVPVEQYPLYAHDRPQRSSQHSPVRRERERPQSQYYQDPERKPTHHDRAQPTDLKHTRSQSNAPLFSLKRKEVENAPPKRAQSVLQHVRVSHGSDISEQSGVSSTNDSQCTAETSTSHYPSQQQPRTTQNNSHHVAVAGAVGYVPQEPVMSQVPAFSKKIVVVGDGGSGKTSLLMRYKERIFPDKYVPTVFENYITLKHHRATGKTVEVALWDTAGQEEYDRLRPLSYPETSVILICFSVDCPQSLDSVKEKWYPEVAHFCPDTPIVLVSNKFDLRNDAGILDLLEGQGLLPCSAEEGQAMSEFIGAKAYIECSSKNFFNVDEVFEAAIDISIAHEQGTDWSRGQVGQALKSGRLGTASQVLSKPGSSGRAENGNKGAGYTKDGIKKKKKSRACKIL